jgi:LytS/YehU family sensor histidine kinase
VTSLEISVAIGVPCTAGAFIYARLHAEIRDREIEKERASAAALEARLASLESRTRPHFLFNALNSAMALIPDEPAAAERVLERLAVLLRASLDSHASVVPLRDELAMMVNYLEIERVRFGERLVYDLDVPDELKSIEIPAFALQTLVENSVKYAVSPRKAGAKITVRARRVENRLVIDVCDDGPGFTSDAWIAGHGLDSLRARLQALYGADATLVVPAASSTGAIVSIEVPA